jgi:hypothetical protein
MHESKLLDEQYHQILTKERLAERNRKHLEKYNMESPDRSKTDLTNRRSN